MVNRREQEALTQTRNDRPDWDNETAPLTKDAIERTLQVPDDLKCQVCKELFKDPVMMPECACEICDECAREALIKEENVKNECPICSQENNNPEELIPVRGLREKVKKFRSAHMNDVELNNISALDRAKKEADSRPTLPDIPLPGITDATDASLMPTSPFDINQDTTSPVYTPKYTPNTPKFTPKVCCVIQVYQEPKLLTLFPLNFRTKTLIKRVLQQHPGLPPQLLQGLHHQCQEDVKQQRHQQGQFLKVQDPRKGLANLMRSPLMLANLLLGSYHPL